VPDSEEAFSKILGARDAIECSVVSGQWLGRAGLESGFACGNKMTEAAEIKCG
jgi:hypothetical protein